MALEDTQPEAIEAVALEPDVRFLLANERTLLAWIRTALTLLAAGVALIHFGGSSLPQASFGITAILLGGLMAAVGYGRFRAADRAIRAAQLPAAGYGPAVQAAGVIAFALAIAAIELTSTLQ
jgi:inner membrane protein YidH